MPTTGKIRSNAIGIFISNESANSGTFSGGTYGDNTSEKNKTKIKLAWTTGVDGDLMYWGKGYITTYEESAGLNEVASFSVNFEGDGTIYKAVLDTNDAVFNNNN
jgi:hypothetical protein